MSSISRIPRIPRISKINQILSQLPKAPPKAPPKASPKASPKVSPKVSPRAPRASKASPRSRSSSSKSSKSSSLSREYKRLAPLPSKLSPSRANRVKLGNAGDECTCCYRQGKVPLHTGTVRVSVRSNDKNCLCEEHSLGCNFIASKYSHDVNEYKKYTLEYLKRDYVFFMKPNNNTSLLEQKCAEYSRLSRRLAEDVLWRTEYNDYCAGKCASNQGHLAYLAKLDTLLRRVQFLQSVCNLKIVERGISEL